jgi:hypothetical protein
MHWLKPIGIALGTIVVALVLIEVARRRGLDLIGKPATLLSQRDYLGQPLSNTTTTETA